MQRLIRRRPGCEEVDMSPRSLLLPGVTAIVVAVLALTLRTQAATAPPASTGATVSQARHVRVAIRNYDFAPKSLTVRVGTRVTWTNDDATAHTATADHGGFDTGTVAPKASRTVDFKHPGTFTYHCVFHAFMTATVTVRR
jgi:plastocyanin